MLDQQDRQAELRSEPADQARQLQCLPRVHSGRRLVEEEQERLGAERAGDLEAALVTVWQVLRQLVVATLQPDEGQQLPGLDPGGLLLTPVARGREDGVDPARTELRVHPHENVLHRRHVLEQTDVLEGPAEAVDDHVVRPGALEDPEPDEETLIPRRPGHADEEDDHQREDREREPDDDRAVTPALDAEADRQQRHQERGQDPHDGLEPASYRSGDDASAGKVDLTGGRVVDPGDDVEERRLARAVRPDEADDRLLGDRELDVVDRDEAAESLRDTRGFEEAHSVPPASLAAPGAAPMAPAISPPPSPSSNSSATWSSCRRRWFGNRPSGRNNIISTRATP